jgi:hypothetical protein
MTEIESILSLGDINLAYDNDRNIIEINGAYISIESDDVDIKDGVRLLIGYHPAQRNIYLILDKIKSENETTFAEMLDSFNNEIEITINPNQSNTISYFGEIIAKEFTDRCQVMITRFEGEVQFTLHLPFEWENTVSIPEEHLYDLLEFADEPDMEETEADE